MEYNMPALVTGILVALFTFTVTIPRLIYFLIRGRYLLGKSFFRGKNLAFFILSFLSSIACVVLSIFYSGDFHTIGLFFMYIIFGVIGISVYLIVWVMFWMHGYEARYQFELIDKIPAPMTILSGFVVLLGACLTTNYYSIACAIIYVVSSLLFDLYGYKRFSPKVYDDDDERY